MPRINISQQTELSLVPGSIVITDALNRQRYLGPGANGDLLTVVAGSPAWTTVPSSFTVAGDAGTNPSILIGTDTLSILGGLGIDTLGNSGADTITVSLNAVLDDLSNVVAPAPTVGQNLQFDGTNWINADPLQFGEYQTTFDASLGVFPGGGGIIAADWFNTTTAGVVDGQSFSIGDLLIAIVNSPSNGTYAANWVRVSPIGSFSQFTVSADGGPAQTILNLDTLNIAGGTNITTTMSASDIVTIDWTGAISDLSDVDTAGAANGAMLYFDGTNWVDFAIGAANQILTVSGGIPTWQNAAATSFTVAASAGTNPSILIGTDTLSILAGVGITTTGNAGADSVTVALNAAINDLTDVVITAAAANEILVYNGANWVDTNGCTWLGNFSVDCLSDVDTTGVGVGDYLAWDGTNFVATTPGGGFTSWTLAGDAGANQTIGDGNIVTFIGGNGIATVTSATDNLTINYDGSLNNNSDVNITAAALNEILAFDGTDWVDTNGCTWLGNFSIDCLGDVNTAGSALGSMLYLSGGSWINLGIGSAGQVLTVAGGIPTWSTTAVSAFTVAGNAGTNPNVVIGTDTLNIVGTGNITTTGTLATDTITIAWSAVLNDLTDVDTTGVANTNILQFNAGNWEDVSGCTWLGNFSIDCLSDVVLTAPAAGQALTYNGTNWVNTTPFITAVSDTDTVDLTITGSTLSADVLFSATAGNVAHNDTGVAVLPVTEYFTPGNGDTTVTLSGVPLAGTPVHVYINGERAPITTEWSIAGAVITFVTAFGPSPGAQYFGSVDVDSFR